MQRPRNRANQSSKQCLRKSVWGGSCVRVSNEESLSIFSPGRSFGRAQNRARNPESPSSSRVQAKVCVYDRCGWFKVLPQITLPQSHGPFSVVRGGSGVSDDRGPLRECGGAFVFGMIYNYIRIIKQNYHTQKKENKWTKTICQKSW